MDIDMQAIGTREVTLWDHSRAPLSSFWKDGPLVLVFLRHYG